MQVESTIDLTKIQEYTKVQEHPKLRIASDFTFKLLDEVCNYIKPGIKESQAMEYCYKIYQDYKIDRIWHKPFIRFGKHTITTFRDHPTEDLILQEEDIAYVDIGIVKDGIEGDAGRTICFGHNPIFNEIKLLTKELFVQAKTFWLQNKVSGIELYDFIEKQVIKNGYQLNLKPAGHLIGAFPHAKAKYKEGFSNYPEIVEPYQWILEIQIRHPTLNVGGFYEEILAP